MFPFGLKYVIDVVLIEAAYSGETVLIFFHYGPVKK